MGDNKYMYDLLAAMSERTIKRLWALCIIVFIALVTSNIAWLWCESQFAEVVTTQEVAQENTNGSNNFIGNDGNITNGYTEDKDNN